MLKKFVEFFDETLYAIRCKNIDECIEGVKNNDVEYITKIKKHCKRYGLQPETTIAKIKVGDRDLASHFCKDPMKQNISEVAQLEFLTAVGLQINKLNADHKFGKFMYNSKVVDSSQLPAGSGLKTIDYYTKFNGKDIYIAAKYTNNVGGAQDNQYNDLMAQYKEAYNISDPNTYFIALCDGNYYDRIDRKAKKSIRELMNDMYQTSHSIALSSDDVYSYLVNLG